MLTHVLMHALTHVLMHVLAMSPGLFGYWRAPPSQLP